MDTGPKTTANSHLHSVVYGFIDMKLLSSHLCKPLGFCMEIGKKNKATICCFFVVVVVLLLSLFEGGSIHPTPVCIKRLSLATPIRK